MKLSWRPMHQSMLFPAALSAQLRQAIDFPINFTKFSSWFRFVRITDFVYRAVRIFRNSVKVSQYRTSLPSYLTAAEFTNAKTKLLQFSQTQTFFPELSAIQSVVQPLPTNSRIKTLTLYICPKGTKYWLTAHPSCSLANLLDNIRSIRHSSRHNALLRLPPSTCLWHTTTNVRTPRISFSRRQTVSVPCHRVRRFRPFCI